MAEIPTTVEAGQVPVSTFRDGLRGWVLGGRFIAAIEGGSVDPPPAADPPATPPPAAPPAGESPPAGPEPFDKDRALATIKQLRTFEKLSKDQAKELEDLRGKVKASDDAKLSETERLQKQADEATERATAAETRARERAIHSEIRVQAAELGFADPSDAFSLIDQTAIELDKDGEPTNVAALLKKLLEAKPYLAKPTNGVSGVPGTPARKNGATPSHEEQVTAAQKEMDKRYGGF